MFSFLKKRSTRSHRQPTRRRRLRMETCEHRMLLAGDAFDGLTNLFVDADSGFGEVAVTSGGLTLNLGDSITAWQDSGLVSQDRSLFQYDGSGYRLSISESLVVPRSSIEGDDANNFSWSFGDQVVTNGTSNWTTDQDAGDANGGLRRFPPAAEIPRFPSNNNPSAGTGVAGTQLIALASLLDAADESLSIPASLPPFASGPLLAQANSLQRSTTSLSPLAPSPNRSQPSATTAAAIGEQASLDSSWDRAWSFELASFEVASFAPVESTSAESRLDSSTPSEQAIENEGLSPRLTPSKSAAFAPAERLPRDEFFAELDRESDLLASTEAAANSEAATTWHLSMGGVPVDRRHALAASAVALLIAQRAWTASSGALEAEKSNAPERSRPGLSGRRSTQSRLT